MSLDGLRRRRSCRGAWSGGAVDGLSAMAKEATGEELAGWGFELGVVGFHAHGWGRVREHEHKD